MPSKKVENLKTVKAKVEPKASKVKVRAEAKAQVHSDKKLEKKSDVSVSVLDLSGAQVGKVSLPGEMFGAKVNPVLMAQAVRVYMANQRIGGASTKTRGEVQGSTRKIYRQKGTGRARHGAIRAPIFVGGGIVFGPRTRDFSLKMPQKMRQKALFSALTSKLQDKRVIVADLFEGTSGKTSEVQKALKALKVTNKYGKGDKVLFITPGKLENVSRGVQNIDGVLLQQAQNMNTHDVINSNYVLLMKSAIDTMKKTFLEKE